MVLLIGFITKTFIQGSHLVTQGIKGGDQKPTEVTPRKFLREPTEAMRTTCTGGGI